MDFRGLWKPKPTKKLTKKKDIIIELKEFRDAWQKLIKLNIELDDDYLEKETLSNLKKNHEGNSEYLSYTFLLVT